MAKLLGNGAPTSNTYGILGQEYIDKLTGKRYVCTKSATVTSNKAGEADHYCEWAEESAGGVSSWNDLTDKPFGEIVKNDTLVVDWDTFEPKVKSSDSGFAKVSDVTLTLDDLVNGVSTPGASKAIEISYDELVSSYNKFGCVYHGYTFAVIPYDNFTLNDPECEINCTFPEKGIYFDAYGRPGYFTVNGFNGFADTTAVKQIERTYLPEPFAVFGNVSNAAEKVLDGTCKFENTMVVTSTNVPGTGVAVLYPTHRAQDDTFTYTSLPYWSESDSKYIVNVEQHLGSDHGVNAGSISNEVVYLTAEQ